ncbi:hypothetical protein VTL71DRAFT_9606 [Oculimacula yallundae]|uniref:Zn(2)-C6 fungal-type domain-containing protein n=1 Tax=Oculimacula yallundae TaxID=86028 RepID=A0ABR4BSY1_9HELO
MDVDVASTRSIRLPSCKQCRQRKVKCDTQRPSCGTCSKNDVACEFVDSSTGKMFTGQYILELEEEQRALDDLFQQRSAEECRSGGEPVLTGDGDAVPSQNEGASPRNIRTSGISFLKLLLADADWRQRNADLLQKLAERPQVAELHLTPSPLPERQHAWSLIERYLHGTHVQNPFLMQRDIEIIFDRVYAEPSSPPKHSKHDLFTIFMIIAVGSVIPYRKGTHDNHPFSYYLAALDFFDPNFLGQTLRGIQDLLLVARFGIYYHIGTSIWDIAQICVRMCIEQGLHRKTIAPTDSVREQLQRRVFWHCYAIDRYSSTTLGRPFAIADYEISVPFPVQVNDDQLFDWTGRLDEMPCDRNNNDMSVFIFYVHLRQITSRMHDCFHTWSRASSPDSLPLGLSGKVHVEVASLLSELRTWRDSAPIFPEATCLYHHAEWHDFMYERYRLLLLRAAIDAVPKQNGIPSRELVDMIAESSIGMIVLYAGLFERGVITYTRSYFQMLFTGGLSLMFSIASLDHLGDFKIQDRATEALKTCEGLLTQFSVQMKDSFYYTAVFEAVHRETIRRSALLYQQFLTSSAPTRRASPTTGATDYGQAQMYAPMRAVPLSQRGSQQIMADAIFQDTQYQDGTTHNMHGSTDDLVAAGNYPFSGSQFPVLDGFGNPMSYIPPFTEASYWDGLTNDWLSMEAGVGEYAYGDPYSNLNMWDQLQLDLNGAQIQ